MAENIVPDWGKFIEFLKLGERAATVSCREGAAYAIRQVCQAFQGCLQNDTPLAWEKERSADKWRADNAAGVRYDVTDVDRAARFWIDQEYVNGTIVFYAWAEPELRMKSQLVDTLDEAKAACQKHNDGFPGTALWQDKVIAGEGDLSPLGYSTDAVFDVRSLFTKDEWEHGFAGFNKGIEAAKAGDGVLPPKTRGQEVAVSVVGIIRRNSGKSLDDKSESEVASLIDAEIARAKQEQYNENRQDWTSAAVLVRRKAGQTLSEAIEVAIDKAAKEARGPTNQ